jgi:radical SAM superfamily enzyme YgiQ (UPF0313 family)
MSMNRKQVLRPRDYLAAEENNSAKSGGGSPSIALVFPNTYYLAMSNLGFQTVQALFNADPTTVCERVFLPDEAVLNQESPRPLRALESGRAVKDFDCVAFSISFETDYLHLLTILDLAGIPFEKADRTEDHPVIIAGGAAITINPEPIADFCDALFVGEAEEAAVEIAQALREGKTRAEKIQLLGKIEGVYLPDEMDFSDVPTQLPTSICPASLTPNSLETRVSLAQLRKYKRRVPADINGFPVESQIYTPYSEFGKLSLIEVQRGCGRGCKFCAEGFIYTPFRQRDLDLIKKQVLRGLKFRNKIGLIGADLLVYPHIVELLEFIHANGGTFSPSSVRVDGLTPEIINLLRISGHKTLAIAPEAGSDALRSGVNKKFNNVSILKIIDDLINADIQNIKMYFMIGLPGETAKDIDDMIDLVNEARKVVLAHARAKKRMGSLIMSINPFIPKPRTPYQVGIFEGVEILDDKVSHIKRQLLAKGGIRIYNENGFFAYVQALLSNGTRHTAEYLREVHRQNGALKKALRAFTGNGVIEAKRGHA